MAVRRAVGENPHGGATRKHYPFVGGIRRRFDVGANELSHDGNPHTTGVDLSAPFGLRGAAVGFGSVGVYSL